MPWLEIISTLIFVLSGIAAFVLYKIWPENAASFPLKCRDVLKIVVGVIYLCSGFVAFVAELIGIFSHR